MLAPAQIINTILPLAVILAVSCQQDGATQHASDDTAGTTRGGSESTSTSTATSSSPTSGMVPSTGTLPSTGQADGSTGVHPTTGMGLTSESSTGGGPLPGVFARWELLDNTATAVEAWATPACGPGTSCYASDFGVPDFDCVNVAYVGQERVGVSYELASGDPLPCYPSYASWDEHPTPYHLDPTCTDDPVTPMVAGSASSIAGVVAGTLYYFSFENAVAAADYYLLSGANCIAYENSGSLVFGVATPVPNSIMTLLGDAPYTIQVAY